MDDYYVKWLFLGFLLGYICGFIGKSIEDRIFRRKTNDNGGDDRHD